MNKFKHLHDAKESKEVRAELLARALNNEEINIERSTEEFWTFKNRMEFMECKKQMEGYIRVISYNLKKDYSRYFASIDNHGTYSLIKNLDDHEVVASRHITKINSLRFVNKLIAGESSRLGITAPSGRNLKFLDVSEEKKLETNGKKK